MSTTVSPEELLQRLQKRSGNSSSLLALCEALAWCIVDAANEDGYPTQEMFDNRIEVLYDALIGEVANE